MHTQSSIIVILGGRAIYVNGLYRAYFDRCQGHVHARVLGDHVGSNQYVRFVKLKLVPIGPLHFERIIDIIRDTHIEIRHEESRECVRDVVCLKLFFAMCFVRVRLDGFGVNIEPYPCIGGDLIDVDRDEQRNLRSEYQVVLDFIADVGVVKLDVVRGPKILFGA